MSFFGGAIGLIVIIVLLTGTSRLKTEVDTQRKIIAEQEKKINSMRWVMERIEVEKPKGDQPTASGAVRQLPRSQQPPPTVTARAPVAQKYRDPSVGGPARPEPENVIGQGVGTLTEPSAAQSAASIVSFTWDKLVGR